MSIVSLLNNVLIELENLRPNANFLYNTHNIAGQFFTFKNCSEEGKDLDLTFQSHANMQTLLEPAEWTPFPMCFINAAPLVF